MEFRIADTFSDSLGRLTNDEQKAVKNTAFDLQMNPVNPGMAFHRLDRPRDKNFWSIRINDDIRLIVHRTPTSLLLCYVDHHDKAYKWAERRKLETHPKTGAAQFVEVRERVEEIVIPRYVEETAVSSKSEVIKPLLFEGVSDDELLNYGVPTDWIATVRAANEDSLLELVDHLPREASEALLEIATGGKPKEAARVPAGSDPFSHPDALRRFRVMADVEELRRALEFPWDKWTIFLHPDQQKLVERVYGGPARVSGSAGTGKTIVALHRAVYLARKHPDSRVLLATFSDTLANALHNRLKRLISNDPRIGERLEATSLNAVGERLYAQQFGAPKVLPKNVLSGIVNEAAAQSPPTKFASSFLESEWRDVVDAWQLDSWESYRDVRRLGRKTRLAEPVRAALWNIFDATNKRIRSGGYVTYAGLFSRLAASIQARGTSPFDYIVIDESQDISIAQLKFVAALGDTRPESLFFAGDLGQRIFQMPFSWRSVGVDIRGRSRTLTVNYRTSHQIRQQADRLLGPETSDVDGNTEVRRGTVSVFNGPSPVLCLEETVNAERTSTVKWLKEMASTGILPHEIGLIVRSERELDRAIGAAKEAGLPFRVLDDHAATLHGHVSVCTMHIAKGLEFRAVAVIACDDEIVPSQERIESVADEADLEEVYATERHLLYVAITRARDYLLITSGAARSEFLDDLKVI